MTESVYHTQGAWEAKENAEFQDILKEMGSLGNAQKAYLVVAVVLLPFMGNFFEGQGEYPTNAMNNISNVDLYDMQTISNSYNQVYEATVEGKAVNDPDHNLSLNKQYMDITQQAYDAANNLLVDVYTNPIFDGTEIPQEVLGNLQTILVYNPSSMRSQTVTYKVDGQTKTKSVPFFEEGDDGDYVEDTLDSWAGAMGPDPSNPGGPYVPLQPGSPGLQEWFAAMQKIQSAEQNNTTLVTDESSTDQSTVNFDNSQAKIFFGSMKGDIKDVVSQQQTDIQNEIPR